MSNESSKTMVSVIIAFLNEQRFLSEAVDSVINQDYTNWEIILVDDGSTDGSTAIAKDYEKKYPGKIIYTEHEGHANKGLSASRNHGIRHGHGEYFTFLDADDVWLKPKLTQQVVILENHPGVSMVCEGSVFWYSWMDKYHKDVVVKVGKEQDVVVEPPLLLDIMYPLGSGYAPCPSGLMIRRAALLRHGGFEEHFTKKYQLYEDQAFLHKIYLTEKVFVSSNCNNKYRQRKESLVYAIKDAGGYDYARKYFLEWFRGYLDEQQYKNETVHARIQQALDKINRKGNPLISIVTPFKDEERFLEDTIKTAIAQTYTNWEYILVDDGSSDRSTEIARSYATKYPGKIMYLEHEGHASRGVCVSRNVGIEKANGDYIAFLDGDDLWLPKKLEKQVELVKKYPQVHMFCEAGHYMNKGRNPKFENVDVPVGVPGDQLYHPPSLIFQLYPLGKGDAPCMSGILIETGMLRAIGGFEESFTGVNSLLEDQAFLFKVYYNAEVYVSSDCNNIYRQRADSSMHSRLAAGHYRAGRKYFLDWLKGYLKKHHVQYPHVNSLHWKSAFSHDYPRLYKYTFGSFFRFRTAIKKLKN